MTRTEGTRSGRIRRARTQEKGATEAVEAVSRRRGSQIGLRYLSVQCAHLRAAASARPDDIRTSPLNARCRKFRQAMGYIDE